MLHNIPRLHRAAGERHPGPHFQQTWCVLKLRLLHSHLHQPLKHHLAAGHPSGAAYVSAHSGEIDQAKQGWNKPHRHCKAGGGGCQLCSALQVSSELCSPPVTLHPQRGTWQKHKPAYELWGCSPLPMETLVGQTKLTSSFTSSSLSAGPGRQIGSGAKLDHSMSWHTGKPAEKGFALSFSPALLPPHE